MNFFEELKHYFDNTTREKVLQDWAKSAEFETVGVKVEDFLASSIQYSCTLDDPPMACENYKTNINPKESLGFLININIKSCKKQLSLL
jgi:hypothetical protein